MKKLILITCSLIICFQLFAQTVQWRGDNRDGYYNETDLLKQWPADGPELVWHFDALGDGHASACVTDDKIFTAGTLDETGYIFAFKMDGSLLWKKPYGKEWVESWPGSRSTPLFHNDKLYLLSSFGKLICWKAENGEEIWSLDVTKDFDGLNIKWGYTENLLIDGDKLFVTVGGTDANIVALNKNTGSLIWKSKGLGEKSAYCSPTIVTHNSTKLLVTQTENHVLGIDAETGELYWSYEHINRWSVQANTPLYHDGKIYVVSGYGKGSVQLALSDDGKSVSKVWENENLDNQMGGVILYKNNLYGGGHNSRAWYVLDWNTGEEVFTTKDIQRGNTIFADGLLYFYDEKGHVNLIQPDGANTKIISQFDVPYGENQHWAHLVIKNQKLYVRHGTSLMVYNIKL